MHVAGEHKLHPWFLTRVYTGGVDLLFKAFEGGGCEVDWKPDDMVGSEERLERLLQLVLRCVRV